MSLKEYLLNLRNKLSQAKNVEPQQPPIEAN